MTSAGIEMLYNEYKSVAAFSIAASLALLALVTLALKTWVKRKGLAATATNGAVLEPDVH